MEVLPLIAEIICVGTELLLGQITNTDAQYLAMRLPDLGIDVYHHVTVGDNRARMRECFETALGRSDILLVTGGLGPTLDDITKEVVAETLGLAMVSDEKSERELRAWFERSARTMTPNNLRQAVFPEGAKILPNACGTAPGCIVAADGPKYVAIMPGPPHELKDMFEKQVEPFLRSLSGDVLVTRVLRVAGVGESSVEHRLRDMIEAQTNPTIAPYASPGDVTLRLTVKVHRREDAVPLLDKTEADIRARLGDAVYGLDEDRLEVVVVRELASRGMTLALAESCTGGRVADRVVSVPGVSAVLTEAHVTYANAAKVRVLGVREETLAAHGAVSAECAREMAVGIRTRAGVDIALSTTGIAGPDGGSPEKPVGLAFIGIADEHGCVVRQVNIRGDRERVRHLTAQNALDMLRRRVLGQDIQ